jgi:hypothetical protein
MKPWKLLPLEHDDFATRLREENGRGTAGRAAPDDGYVVFKLHEGPHVTPPRQLAKGRLQVGTQILLWFSIEGPAWAHSRESRGLIQNFHAWAPQIAASNLVNPRSQL